MQTNEIKRIHDKGSIYRHGSDVAREFIGKEIIGNREWYGYEHSDGTKVFMASRGCLKEETLILRKYDFLLFSQFSMQNGGVLKLRDGNLLRRGVTGFFNGEVSLRMTNDEFSATNMKETLKKNGMEDVAAVIDKYVPETYDDMLTIRDNYEKTVTHQKNEKAQQDMKNNC